jgi:hypothetical protein
MLTFVIVPRVGVRVKAESARAVHATHCENCTAVYTVAAGWASTRGRAMTGELKVLETKDAG